MLADEVPKAGAARRRQSGRPFVRGPSDTSPPEVRPPVVRVPTAARHTRPAPSAHVARIAYAPVPVEVRLGRVPVVPAIGPTSVDVRLKYVPRLRAE